MGPDGYPLTWLHYQLGIATIGREMAREAVRLYGAFGATQSIKQDRDAWKTKMDRLAEW